MKKRKLPSVSSLHTTKEDLPKYRQQQQIRQKQKQQLLNEDLPIFKPLTLLLPESTEPTKSTNPPKILVDEHGRKLTKKRQKFLEQKAKNLELKAQKTKAKANAKVNANPNIKSFIPNITKTQKYILRRVQDISHDNLYFNFDVRFGKSYKQSLSLYNFAHNHCYKVFRASIVLQRTTNSPYIEIIIHKRSHRILVSVYDFTQYQPQQPRILTTDGPWTIDTVFYQQQNSTFTAPAETRKLFSQQLGQSLFTVLRKAKIYKTPRYIDGLRLFKQALFAAKNGKIATAAFFMNGHPITYNKIFNVFKQLFKYQKFFYYLSLYGIRRHQFFTFHQIPYKDINSMFYYDYYAPSENYKARFDKIVKRVLLESLVKTTVKIRKKTAQEQKHSDKQKARIARLIMQQQKQKLIQEKEKYLSKQPEASSTILLLARQKLLKLGINPVVRKKMLQYIPAQTIINISPDTLIKVVEKIAAFEKTGIFKANPANFLA